MQAGNDLFCAGRGRYFALGLGFICQKTIKNGMVIGFEQEKESYQDYGICAFGQWDLVKILARKWGIDPPPPLSMFQLLTGMRIFTLLQSQQ